MALLHASQPPAQACGGEDTLYIYIFLIFPGHQVLDPIANPYLGPPFGCTVLQNLKINSPPPSALSDILLRVTMLRLQVILVHAIFASII